ncbi:MAG: cytidine deaminase [Defluviitaleaceae bacterium]|nr:cytidine deaminase [Defluviitaleaceae bacterium]
MNNADLVKKAILARENSYSPYSNFMVGAALLTDCGKVFLGCNIENAAYSPTICAERSAFSASISNGFTKFSKIAIAGFLKGKNTGEAFPCGVCRQVIKEFCTKDFEIIIVRSKDEYTIHTLEELFPNSFGPENL